jgi:cell division protein ZapA (FtsZ GTPase activity inhibitor)
VDTLTKLAIMAAVLYSSDLAAYPNRLAKMMENAEKARDLLTVVENKFKPLDDKK